MKAPTGVPAASCEICFSEVAVKACDHCGKLECGDCRDACAAAKFLETNGPVIVKNKLHDRLGPAGTARLELP